MKTEGVSLYSLNLAELKKKFNAQNLPSYGAEQSFHWVYKKHEFDLLKWSSVSKKAKIFLQEHFDWSLPKIVLQRASKDGTRKFLLQFKDQKSVETVLIAGARGRRTLCLSSQVGCAVGCRFCHTGTMGLTRHLSADEIVGQFLEVSRWLKEHKGEKITNVVYMGQGEPLHNFEQVKRSVEILMDEKGLGIGQRKITLSTSGLVPKIKKLGDFPPVNVAISLHAARDEVRSELMPLNKIFDLERLFEAIKTIPLKAHRRITYEYILIAGLNDQKKDVEGLARLLDRKRSKINIIPFNEYPQSSFSRPDPEKIKWFQRELLRKGHTCTVRTTKGDDILAACGQLKSRLP